MLRAVISRLWLFSVIFSWGCFATAPAKRGLCDDNRQCDAGEVCASGECKEVCVSGGCPLGFVCASHGLCELCEAGPCFPPSINTVNGTGALDPDPTHGERHFNDRIEIIGSSLLGSDFVLESSVGTKHTLESLLSERYADCCYVATIFEHWGLYPHRGQPVGAMLSECADFARTTGQSHCIGQ